MEHQLGTSRLSSEDGIDRAHESEPLLSPKKPYGIIAGATHWFDNLCNNVGYQFLALLFFIQHLRGFVFEFAGQALPFLMRTYHIPAPTMQIYQSVAGLPWAMKPVIGLISDIFPINGYRKGPYMAGASVIGTIAFVAIGAVPHSSLPVLAVVGCGFLCQNQLATNDILCEARYAQKIQEKPHIASSIMTFVWLGVAVMGLLGTSTSGLAIHKLGPKACFLICAIPTAMSITPVMLGYLEEKQLSRDDLARIRESFSKQWEACFLCVQMLGAVLCLMLTVAVTHNPVYNAIVSLVVFIVMLISFSVTLSPTIAKFNAFSLIQTSLTVSTAGAGFYFMTDTVHQYPEGPHFSDMFYTSVLGTVGAVVSMIGIVSYERYLSGWPFRNLLVITNISISLLSCVDVIFYKRLNVEWGFPDQWFVLSSSVLSGVISQWQSYPLMLLYSYMCPKGMEATMFALLAGCHNLGGIISQNFGAFLLHHMGVTPDGSVAESDKMENLWCASLIASILPIFTILALFRLIPDIRQGDRAIDPEAGATSGSLLNQWRGVVAEKQADS